MVRIDGHGVEHVGVASPGCLDFVGSDEKRLVALHQIVEQRRVFAGQGTEVALVANRQRYLLNRDLVAGCLHVEIQVESFVRLQSQEEQVAMARLSPWKRCTGGSRYRIKIRVVRIVICLPVRRKNGTPCHRQLSMASRIAT